MAMTTETQGNIDLSAILNAYLYMDIQRESYNGMTLEEILDDLYRTDPTISDNKYYQTIREAIAANSSIGEIKLIDQSHYSDVELASGSTEYGGTCQDDLIQACAFQVGDDVYVAYRGTGDGRWADNGEGYTEVSTNMQEAATEYFDYVVEKYELADSDGDLYVTGHSKGGNEAQYVMMTSKYREDIDACYSFDGQGFSEAAIEQFKKINPDYEERLQKMYSIDGTDDYVHVLINPIIPEENTYYVDYVDDGFASKHDIYYLIDGAGVMWQYDADGEVSHGEQGWVSKTAEELNQKILELDEDDQAVVAMLVMEFLEVLIDDENSKYLYAMDEDGNIIVDFIRTVAKVTGFSKIEALAEAATKAAYTKWGIPGVIALVTVTALVAPFVYSVVQIVKIVDFVCDVVKTIVNTAKAICEKLSEMAQKAWQKLKNFAAGVVVTLQKIKDFLNNTAYGYNYAAANPTIVINTGKMRTYASQLRSLSKRSKTLDSNMNSLYWQLGINWNTFSNLGKLLKGEIILDFAYRLDACASYLEQTAQDFESVEKTVSKWFA